MKIFKTKWFSRFARQNRLSDHALCEAIRRAERGLIDADLGGGVIKQRIPRPNEGRSGEFRSILYFRAQERAFFVFGFAKNDLDNISADDLKDYKSAAELTLNLEAAKLAVLLEAEELTEVNCDEQEIQK